MYIKFERRHVIGAAGRVVLRDCQPDGIIPHSEIAVKQWAGATDPTHSDRSSL